VEETPDDARTRYYIEAAVIWFFGSVIWGPSLLSMVRLDIVKMVPAILSKVDAQTSDLLNVLLPSQPFRT